PFSPLARGLMTNTLDLDKLGANDFRRALPRYQGEHAENNKQLSAAFAELAGSKGCSPAQLAIAWVLAQGEYIIPIPGTKRRKYLMDNAGSVEVSLSPTDLEQIAGVITRYPNIGDRYNAANNKFLEKK
ncbi:MAG TPA: aldo/keto reductase, partial [Puia sp.]|nr:aldo/keto reductase [Puia sp.]